MKYFEKIAAGPTVQLSNIKEGPTGAFYIKSSGKGKKALIVGNIGKNTLPWMKDTTKQSLIKHELVHHLRSKKKKWSSLASGKSRIATFVEEFAAYNREGKSIGRSAQGALATATRFRGPVYKILKAIK